MGRAVIFSLPNNSKYLWGFKRAEHISKETFFFFTSLAADCERLTNATLFDFHFSKKFYQRQCK